ncbi:MAG: methionyl-tRNA formyltransferase [bacterium]|nr:methionyl-tRNA formyltransferase [bacterium]
MRIVFWGKGARGVACLRALQQHGDEIACVVVHPDDAGHSPTSVRSVAAAFGIPVIAPENPNADAVALQLRAYRADLFVLGGYGKIIAQRIIDIPFVMTINLHGGKLPEYRGSSPMNWALIRGETSFTLSVIKVASGVDAGDVILDRTFPIGAHDTIVDLHTIAEREFPVMLMAAVEQLAHGTAALRVQDVARAAYLPLRFPDDGLILWDQLTAQEAHNRIRALTAPYPCAFTYADGRKVQLLRSELATLPMYGEPGRIYRITERGMLICAADRALWIVQATFADDGTPLRDAVQRYDRLATVREAVHAWYQSRATVAAPPLMRGTSP